MILYKCTEKDQAYWRIDEYWNCEGFEVEIPDGFEYDRMNKEWIAVFRDPAGSEYGLETSEDGSPVLVNVATEETIKLNVI